MVREPRRVSSKPQPQTLPSWGAMLQCIGLGYSLALLGLSLIHYFSPQRSGWVALTQIVAPYLFFPLLLFVPFAILRGWAMWGLRIGLALCTIVFVRRFPLDWNREILAPPSNFRTFAVMHWNVKTSNPQEQDFHQYLLAQEVDVVALGECDWTSIAQDINLAKRYPYRLLRPADGAPPGIALLSKYPIEAYGVLQKPMQAWDIPRVLWARLNVGPAQSLVVVVAHPRPPQLFNVECGFICAEQRDAQIAAVADLVANFVAHGESVLLLGDLNLTEREIAYTDVTAVLNDVHNEVGKGWGHTWGTLGILPLLRIDYLMATESIVPFSLDVDCNAPGSDHCSVFGQFFLPIRK